MSYYTINQVAEKAIGEMSKKNYDKVINLCRSEKVKPSIQSGHVRLFTDADVEQVKKLLQSKEEA